MQFFFSTHHKTKRHVKNLYEQTVQWARQPWVYQNHHIEDTFDRRFDILCLSLFCTLTQLAHNNNKNSIQQQLIDRTIADFDDNLREMGVGDMSVGKRVKTMAHALFGRLEAYNKAYNMPNNNQELTNAILRNVYRIAPAKASLARLEDAHNLADIIINRLKKI